VPSGGFLIVGLKTILCIDDKQLVPFRSSKILEPAGYMVFRVCDTAMAGKVSELFKIDFVLGEPDGALPLEIIEKLAIDYD
jgi:hypothetical protein